MVMVDINSRLVRPRDKQRTELHEQKKTRTGRRREGVEEERRRRIFLSRWRLCPSAVLLSLSLSLRRLALAGLVVYPASADCCHGNALPRPSPTSAAVPPKPPPGSGIQLQLDRPWSSSSFAFRHGGGPGRPGWLSWLRLTMSITRENLDSGGAQQAVDGRCRHTVSPVLDPASQPARNSIPVSVSVSLSLSSSSSLSLEPCLYVCGVPRPPRLPRLKGVRPLPSAHTVVAGGCDQLRLSNDRPASHLRCFSQTAR